MRISDWSSDVCSSDLDGASNDAVVAASTPASSATSTISISCGCSRRAGKKRPSHAGTSAARIACVRSKIRLPLIHPISRSEEHTSELQSLMRLSSDVFCLKTKNTETQHTQNHYN